MNKNELYRRALSNVAAKRQRALTFCEAKKSEINEKLPTLNALMLKRVEMGIKIARLSACGAETQEVNEAISALAKLDSEKTLLLQGGGYTNSSLSPQFSCKMCNDTGRIDGEMCECVHAEARRIRQNELSAVSPLALCSFNSFSLLKYPDDKVDNISVREHMAGILQFCEGYANDFSRESGSLYLCGSAGLGKTHLALSIANVVLQKGYDVLYVSAQAVFDTIEKEHFQSGGDTLAGLLRTQLLILDDLGTEYLTPYIGSCLYDIINTRWNRKLPTIYTSNFVRTDELSKRYTEKIVSRLLGSCETLHFLGDDIRLLEK
ncbi:MAG: ATP-binding protein [Oscillospiraceae bacterium]